MMKETKLTLRNQEKLEGVRLKLLVLILDICASFVLTGIAFSKHKKASGSDVSVEAKLSVMVFCGVGIAYILFTAGHYICKFSTEEPFERSKHGHGMLKALGGLCYYIGDNLPPLIKIYEGEIGITQGWVEGIQVAGIVVLGAATVTYLPVLIDGALPHKKKSTEEAVAFIRNKETEEKTPAHVVVLLLLAKATNLDLVYTAIERAASNKCSEKVMGGAWLYFAVYFIAFFLVCWHEMPSYDKEETKEPTLGNETCKCILCTKAIVAAILISAFAAFYILADNRLPLACSGNLESDRVAQDIIRLLLWGATIFFGILVIICWRCHKCNMSHENHKYNQETDSEEEGHRRAKHQSVN